MKKSDVIDRLEFLGYEYDETKDSYGLDYTISKIDYHIKNVINDAVIPDDVECVRIDMICADFLKTKKGFGQLTDVEFDEIAKSVRLGDTNITFADDASPEQKFDIAIEYLLTHYESDLLRFRKLVW